MGLIIICIILTIGTCFILGVDFNKESFEFRPRMLFGLVWLVMILFGCFSQVKTGEIGIKTKFGRKGCYFEFKNSKI